ncbi:MAG TPA: hypothetical protein VLT79_01600 [Gemmatimonadales bacterium]|nr:hypothetical protein [Gemmatimonadales bacterium]
MEFAYRPEVWKDLFAVVGLSTAALTGLLSVALSIHVRPIVANATHLARARESVFALIVPLVVSIFVLIPQQGRVPLGIELLVTSLVVLALGLRLQARTVRRLAPRRRGPWIRRLIIVNSATLAITIAGVSLIIGRLGGMLWLLPHVLICLLWSTYNGWKLMIGVADETGEGTPEAPLHGRVEHAFVRGAAGETHE